MIEIQYKGETIQVENERTPYSDVVDISEENLFVCEANAAGKRYALDMEELYEYMTVHNNLLNFQVVPNAPFSMEDIRELRKRHSGINEFVGNYLELCTEPLEKISAQTVLQIHLLAKRAG